MDLTENGNPSVDNDDHDGGVAGPESGISAKGSLIPPYWSHRRNESYASVENTKPPPITLEDHTEGHSEQSGSCWARGVTIDGYVVVTGTVPNVGNFVVWNCKIDTLDVSFDLYRRPLLFHSYLHSHQGGSIVIRKRSTSPSIDRYIAFLC